MSTKVTTLDTAKEKMTRSELDAAIVLPKTLARLPSEKAPSGQVDVVYTQNNQQSALALISILQNQFNAVNQTITPTEVPFTVKGEQLSENSLSAFDYTFAGLLGFAIIGMGILAQLTFSQSLEDGYLAPP